MKLKENETIPNSEFFIMADGSPVKKNIFEFFTNKKVILFGLPGELKYIMDEKENYDIISNNLGKAQQYIKEKI